MTFDKPPGKPEHRRKAESEEPDRLMPIVYEELKGLARYYLSGERPGHTLSPTALVHEAYIRLARETPDLQGKTHFFALAATAMRRVLIDHARARSRKKRGGGNMTLSLEEGLTVSEQTDFEEFLMLDRALDRLETGHPEKARVVELRFFGGLTAEETSEVMGLSERTVYRYWEYAQAWLYREMTGPSPG